MRFGCLSCADQIFTVDSASLVNEPTPVVTFRCPLCMALNAISHRPGGGLIVSIDAHAESIEAGLAGGPISPES